MKNGLGYEGEEPDDGVQQFYRGGTRRPDSYRGFRRVQLSGPLASWCLSGEKSLGTPLTISTHRQQGTNELLMNIAQMIFSPFSAEVNSITCKCRFQTRNCRNGLT